MDAQYLLGTLYSKGADITIEEALTWTRKAAEQGHVEACAQIGMSPVIEKIFPEFDRLRRREYLMIAADRGSASACYTLAVEYATGTRDGIDDGKTDSAEAFKWYSKAAEAGDAEAIFNAAIMILNGEGCSQNTKRGIEMLASACFLGNQQASKFLHTIYYDGLYGCAKNRKIAKLWTKLEWKFGKRANLSERRWDLALETFRNVCK